MILEVLVAVSLAAEPIPAMQADASATCTEEVSVYLQSVGEALETAQASYLCLIGHDRFLEGLLGKIDATPIDEAAHPRYTRALALHLATRSERPLDVAHVRRLNPADRRLLADAVKAKAGRKSPAAAHDAVFQKMPWYAPREGYTDGRLTEVQRHNIALANKPPTESVAASRSPAPVPEPLPPPASLESPTAPASCGCAVANLGGIPWVMALFAVRRRRA